jgi:hypothetical protein
MNGRPGMPCPVLFNFKHSIYQLLQIPSKAHSMPILFKSIIQPHPKRCMHFQNITEGIYVSNHILLGISLSPHQIVGPKKDEKGVEDFENAFKELSTCVSILYYTIGA